MSWGESTETGSIENLCDLIYAAWWWRNCYADVGLQVEAGEYNKLLCGRSTGIAWNYRMVGIVKLMTSDIVYESEAGAEQYYTLTLLKIESFANSMYRRW